MACVETGVQCPTATATATATATIHVITMRTNPYLSPHPQPSPARLDFPISAFISCHPGPTGGARGVADGLMTDLASLAYHGLCAFVRD